MTGSGRPLSQSQAACRGDENPKTVPLAPIPSELAKLSNALVQQEEVIALLCQRLVPICDARLDLTPEKPEDIAEPQLCGVADYIRNQRKSIMDKTARLGRLIDILEL